MPNKAPQQSPLLFKETLPSVCSSLYISQYSPHQSQTHCAAHVPRRALLAFSLKTFLLSRIISTMDSTDTKLRAEDLGIFAGRLPVLKVHTDNLQTERGGLAGEEENYIHIPGNSAELPGSVWDAF